MDQIGNLNLRYTKTREGVKVETFIKDVTMISKVIKIGIYQTAEIRGVN